MGPRQGRAAPLPGQRLPFCSGLRTFLTTGEKESRAWPFKAGATAAECAGVIHSDFQRGFIRADTIEWRQLLQAGSWTAAREQGLVRSEGKGLQGRRRRRRRVQVQRLSSLAGAERNPTRYAKCCKLSISRINFSSNSRDTGAAYLPVGRLRVYDTRI